MYKYILHCFVQYALHCSALCTLHSALHQFLPLPPQVAPSNMKRKREEEDYDAA